MLCDFALHLVVCSSLDCLSVLFAGVKHGGAERQLTAELGLQSLRGFIMTTSWRVRQQQDVMCVPCAGWAIQAGSVGMLFSPKVYLTALLVPPED